MLDVSEPRYCACGCGQVIEPKRHHKWRGVPDYCRGHNPASERKPREDSSFIRNGYRYVWVAPRTYRGEHRVVMERILGRRLGRWEAVHHIDHDRLNNDPSNLMLLTYREHIHQHIAEPHQDARRHVHKHYDCECGKSRGLDAAWRERNTAQRAALRRGPDGKFAS